MTTIFGKIISGEMPAEVVYENDRVIAIKDINPIAPVHLLIMPKKEIKNLQAATMEDLELIKECLQAAQELADEFGVKDNYRLLTNNGEEAGQTIFHFHFHLIGGRTLRGMG